MKISSVGSYDPTSDTMLKLHMDKELLHYIWFIPGYVQMRVPTLSRS